MIKVWILAIIFIAGKKIRQWFAIWDKVRDVGRFLCFFFFFSALSYSYVSSPTAILVTTIKHLFNHLSMYGPPLCIVLKTFPLVHFSHIPVYKRSNHPYANSVASKVDPDLPVSY